MNYDQAQTMYLRFVEERHRVWERRGAGQAPPFSTDPILAKSKFTNVYRVLDAGSQYLLREQLEAPGTWNDRVMRAFLYRYTNRPEPWVYYGEQHGSAPSLQTLRDGRLRATWEGYGKPVFGIAYRAFGGLEGKGITRLDWVLRMAERVLTDEFLDELHRLDTMAARHALLTTIPRVGDFMGMQILTDIGYFDPSHDENDFVVAGPGSKRGSAAIGMVPSEAFRWSFEYHRTHGSVMLEVSGGVWRTPSMMDIQNTFCEFSKYYRYRVLGGAPRGYRPNPHPPAPAVFPTHWSR